MTDAKPQLLNWSFSKLKQDFHSRIRYWQTNKKQNKTKKQKQKHAKQIGNWLTQFQLCYSTRMQKVQNSLRQFTAAVHLILRHWLTECKAPIITLFVEHRHAIKTAHRPLLHQLHWLPISKRIMDKTACTCYWQSNHWPAVSAAGPLLSLIIFLSCYPFTVLPAQPCLRFSLSDTRMLKLQRFNRKTHGFRTFSERLFIRTQTHSLQIFGVVPFFKLQNDTYDNS